jgi:hypothetical protein
VINANVQQTPPDSLHRKVPNLPRARPFLLSAAFILFITALAKVLTLSSTSAALTSNNPVFPFITQRTALAAAAAAELMIAVGIVVNWPLRQQLLALISLTTTFGVYRLALYFLAANVNCECLGTQLPLGLGPTAQNRLTLFLLLYMLFGALILIRKARQI